ncbi:hypothetical protein C8Q79DRAFT_1014448 [Trametes meyenii]|nr:hypothetical protein C8Q79DRAFT_1014448 [Trametes meyenii]
MFSQILTTLTLAGLVAVNAVPSTLRFSVDIPTDAANADVDIVARIETYNEPQGQFETVVGSYTGAPAANLVIEQGNIPDLPFATFPGCTARQTQDITQAIDRAEIFIRNAADVLGTPPASSARYVAWFGQFSSDRGQHVLGCYSNLEFRNNFKDWTYNCRAMCPPGPGGAVQEAFVNPNTRNVIQLCPPFFQLPVGGPKSMASVLVREATRFTALCATEEQPIGPGECHAVAQQHPDEAVKHAGSYEFFASNHPVPQQATLPPCERGW